MIKQTPELPDKCGWISSANVENSMTYKWDVRHVMQNVLVHKKQTEVKSTVVEIFSFAQIAQRNSIRDI